MKKTLLFIAALFFSCTLFSQTRTTDIPASKLPAGVTQYLQDNLPGSTITKAAKVEEKGDITYNVTIDVKGKKHQFVFDKAGKFLRKGDALIDSTKPKPAPAAKPVEHKDSVQAPAK